MVNYRVVDMEKNGRKKISEYFSSFGNPNYSVCVKMDVTKVVEYSKKRKTSVFADTMYLISIALNGIEEMRYRILGDKIVCYDKINPGWTAKTNLGAYRNCNAEMEFDYSEFYEKVESVMENVKNEPDAETENSRTNPGYLNIFYFTCTPWLNFISVTHPLPLNDKESLSIPRIAWGKFTEENGKLVMPLDICVSHILMDGATVAKAFSEIQKRFDEPEKFIP